MILVTPADQRWHRNDAGHDICRSSGSPLSQEANPLSTVPGLVAVSDELLMPGASGVSVPPEDVEIVTIVIDGEVELGTCAKHRTLRRAGTVHYRPAGLGHQGLRL